MLGLGLSPLKGSECAYVVHIYAPLYVQLSTSMYTAKNIFVSKCHEKTAFSMASIRPGYFNKFWGFKKFIYLFLFLAVLGLRCCVWDFSS